MQCSRRTHPIAPTGKKRQKTLTGRVLGEVVRLKGLTNLQSLNLNNTQIIDAGLINLKGMTRLQSPWVCDTQVTRTGIAELQQALPNCRIRKPAIPGAGVGPAFIVLPSAARPRSPVKAQPLQIKGLDQRPQSESKTRRIFGTAGCRFKPRRPCCKSGPSPYGSHPPFIAHLTALDVLWPF